MAARCVCSSVLTAHDRGERGGLDDVGGTHSFCQEGLNAFRKWQQQVTELVGRSFFYINFSPATSDVDLPGYGLLDCLSVPAYVCSISGYFDGFISICGYSFWMYLFSPNASDFWWSASVPAPNDYCTQKRGTMAQGQDQLSTS